VQGPFDYKRDRIALATTTDLQSIEKHGIVGPDITSKAAKLFPEKIGDKYTMLYTLRSDSPRSSIMIAQFDSLDDVKNPPDGFMEENARSYDRNVIFPSPPGAHRGPESGTAPVKTKDGWLLIYCGANMLTHDEWTIDAALLDHDDPQQIIAHSTQSLLAPETEKEKRGIIKNVAFPSAAVVDENADTISVYYGSGDEVVSLATGKLSRLLGSLEEVPRRS
jgi:predicted GH43/DUF377 family glycosyl hydrolase